jgi:endonuclease/exonuclease/phosphatase family metal-dependent hydrolase
MIGKRFVDTATAVETPGARDARRWGTFVRSKRRIDYIFIDPRYFDVLDAGVTLPKTPASDHRAYFAKLRVK